MTISFGWRRRKGLAISKLLLRHFGKTRPEDLCISDCQFSYGVRTDLQRAIDQVIGSEKGLKRFCGVASFFGHETADLSVLISQSEPSPSVAVPPQYEEVDIGEDQPTRCLRKRTLSAPGSGSI